ncbi:hypothetical protein RG47T_4855 [Mucilaginibacter polytrichastri]|uniref:Uncharacterized protein n=1 Tax=Mucilaginibacter polytrichastri TaxID=1302689 RepID=A0A1Q6A5T2_9SPHI|nr:hypothetical protein RG47T_4855 [Mucilaginibacter polytrichastri]
MTLLVVFCYNTAAAQMIRNHAVHFNRHRAAHHHHKGR